MNNLTENLDFKNIKFSKIDGHEVDNTIQYIIDYLNIHNSKTLKISIGCDSKNKVENTLYVFTISFYDFCLNNGAHYIKAKYFQKRVKDTWSRLYNEAVYLKELGNYLEIGLKGYYKPIFIENNKPTKLVEVHLDLNPAPTTKLKMPKSINRINKKTPRKFSTNLSNSVYDAGVSLLTSDGFVVVSKPNAYSSSSAADKHTK
jgi:predicted RNase H-related nuclease YkuK (DUF458 family)